MHIHIYLYISSVYSSFSDRGGLPLHNINSSGVLMKSIGAEYLRPHGLPDVHHVHGMHYQIVLTITFWPLIQLYKFVCTIPTQNRNINSRCKPTFSCNSRPTSQSKQLSRSDHHTQASLDLQYLPQTNTR